MGLLCGMGPNKEQYFIGDFDGTTFTIDPDANGYLLRGDGIPGAVFADFEDGLPDGWTVEGGEIAVGANVDLGLYKVTGALGAGFLSTYTPGSLSGDRGTATVYVTDVYHRAQRNQLLDLRRRAWQPSRHQSRDRRQSCAQRQRR